jgi:hypothetical protein
MTNDVSGEQEDGEAADDALVGTIRVHGVPD